MWEHSSRLLQAFWEGSSDGKESGVHYLLLLELLAVGSLALSSPEADPSRGSSVLVPEVELMALLEGDAGARP